MLRLFFLGCLFYLSFLFILLFFKIFAFYHEALIGKYHGEESYFFSVSGVQASLLLMAA